MFGIWVKKASRNCLACLLSSYVLALTRITFGLITLREDFTLKERVLELWCKF
jgi:hypothetical protein